MPYLDRNGVRIHYEARGRGPAVVLTHGYTASSRMFARNVDALAADHTVVTWDLRGHGRSDYPADPAAYSVPLVVGDLAALLDEVGATRAAVAGHSVGGYLALEFHLAHPERVEALVLVDTGPGFRRDDARARWNDTAERYARGFAERGLGAMADGEELDPSAHRDASGLVHFARHVLVQRDARVLESLGSVAVPALVLVGERDAAFLDGSRYMAAKIPDAELVVVEGAGHAPNVTHPEAFDGALAPFLRRLQGAHA